MIIQSKTVVNDWELKIAEIMLLNDLKQVIIVVSGKNKDLLKLNLEFPERIVVLSDQEAEAQAQIDKILKAIY